jgi:hypothetical protein
MLAIAVRLSCKISFTGHLHQPIVHELKKTLNKLYKQGNELNTRMNIYKILFQKAQF